MERTEFDKYLTERYEDQFNWIDNKAGKLKRTYTRYQTWVIVLAASTTVLAAVGSVAKPIGTIGQWAAVVVSALVTILTSVLATFKHKETWLNYRATAEALKREQYYYRAQIGDYSGAQDKEGLFVQRVEAILASENAEWLGIQRLKDEAGQPKAPVNPPSV